MHRSRTLIFFVNYLACSTNQQILTADTGYSPEFDFDYTSNNVQPLSSYKADLTFVGDIFWSRGVNRFIERQNKPFDYLFENLNDFAQPSSTWIGNIECPIVTEQVPYAIMKQLLKFSCRSEYLEGFKKSFTAVSLANNHSDNMGLEGFIETKEYLEASNVQYFGHYDSSLQSEICEIIEVPIVAIDKEGYPYVATNPDEIVLQKWPIALCGYHGVKRLPLQKEISVIQHYAAHFFTISMPHQGVEYEPYSNKYQQRIYRAMIDAGADLVIGAHPHVIQEVEQYNNRLIFYSLGNFIFDQTWTSSVRQGLVVNIEIDFESHTEDDHFWNRLNCQEFKDDCLLSAQAFDLRPKPFSAKVTPMVSVSQYFQPTRATAAVEDKVFQQIHWNDNMEIFTNETEFDIDH